MKNLSVSLFIFLGSISICESSFAVSKVKTWRDEDKKILYYLPNPILKLKVLNLSTGDFDFDSMLDLSLSYYDPNPEQASALDELKRLNPGFTLSRSMLRPSGSIHVSIPSLGISEDINPRPGVEGPYVNNVYYLNVNQTPILRTLFHANEFIEVTGQVSVTHSDTTVETFIPDQLKEGDL